MSKKTYSTQDFWDKKATISYILAIMVFFIHHSSYGQYSYGEDLTSTAVKILGNLFPAVAQVAVPLFMIIAGALFFRNYEQAKYGQKIKKRVKTLLVPYLTWNTLSMLFSIAVTIFLAKYFVARQPFEFSTESVLKSIFCHDQNGPFWFVADLMLYIVLSPAINTLINKKLIGGGYLLIISVLHVVGAFPERLLFDSSSLIYYSIGAYIGKHNFELMKVKNIIPNVLSIAIILVAVFWSYVRLNYHPAVTEMFTEAGVRTINLVVRLSYCLAFWSIFDAILPKLLPVRGFYSHSFWVYAMHINVGGIVAKLLFLAMPKSVIFAPINHLLNTIITLTLISLTAFALKKWCMPVYKVLSGDRG